METTIDTNTVTRLLQGGLRVLYTLPMEWATTTKNGQPDGVVVFCDLLEKEGEYLAFSEVKMLAQHIKPTIPGLTLLGARNGSQALESCIQDKELEHVFKAVLLRAGCILVNNTQTQTGLFVQQDEASAHATLSDMQPFLDALLSFGWTPGTSIQSCAQAARRFVKASPNNHTIRW